MKFHEVERSLANESSTSQVTEPLYTRSIGRWRTDLKEADKQVVKDVAGPLLIELGYTEDDNW